MVECWVLHSVLSQVRYTTLSLWAPALCIQTWLTWWSNVVTECCIPHSVVSKSRAHGTSLIGICLCILNTTLLVKDDDSRMMRSPVFFHWLRAMTLTESRTLHFPHWSVHLFSININLGNPDGRWTMRSHHVLSHSCVYTLNLNSHARVATHYRLLGEKCVTECCIQKSNVSQGEHATLSSWSLHLYRNTHRFRERWWSWNDAFSTGYFHRGRYMTRELILPGLCFLTLLAQWNHLISWRQLNDAFPKVFFHTTVQLYTLIL